MNSATVWTSPELYIYLPTGKNHFTHSNQLKSLNAQKTGQFGMQNNSKKKKKKSKQDDIHSRGLPKQIIFLVYKKSGYQ